MNCELLIRNRHRNHRINARLLRRIIQFLLTDLLEFESVELGIQLVGETQMARVNWQYLQHQGPTDVITFDHAEFVASPSSKRMVGELFICLDVAVRQAREFRTTWPDELVRYIVHGVLHLLGYDDRRAALRRVMKREENRLLRMLQQQFVLAELNP